MVQGGATRQVRGSIKENKHARGRFDRGFGAELDENVNVDWVLFQI